MTEERIDPADELRRDIESAYDAQQPKESEPSSEPESEPDLASSTEEPSPETRERDEKGRFIAKAPGDEEPAAEPAVPAKEEKVEPAATEPAKTDVRPPPGFSVASKAVWDELPQSVRDDIAKREEEMISGLKRYNGLRQFAEEAERNGTTLQNAVADYVAVESALRHNPVGGVEFICQRMGIDPRQLAQSMGQRYGIQPVDPRASWQPNTQLSMEDETRRAIASAQQQPPAPVVDPNAIAQHVAQQVAQQLRTETEQRELASKVAAFGADPKNKFYANVRPLMAQLVQAGAATSIEQAYDAACWLNPEIRALQIDATNGGRNKEAAAVATKSRAAAKAVGGAPAPGVNPDETGKRKNLSLDEEIRAAIDAQAGAA